MNTTVELQEAKASDYLTYHQAAEILNVTENWIRYQVAKGALISYRFKTATILSTKEIGEFKRMREISKRC